MAPPSPIPPIVLNLQVPAGRATDRSLYVQAAQWLHDCLASAQASLPPAQRTVVPDIVYQFFTTDDELAALTPGIVVLSLFAALADFDTPFATTSACLQASVQALGESSLHPVFLCTLFRHVPAGTDSEGGDARRQRLRERIRRLDLLAIELSASTGVNVVDLDRVLAHLGAVPLQTDYRLGGDRAAAVVADTLCGALLMAGLDDVVPDGLLGAAQGLHDGLPGIVRRFHQRCPAHAAVPAAETGNHG